MSYVPNPDQERVYPLRDGIDLIVAHVTDRSYDCELIISGLTVEQAEFLAESLTQGKGGGFESLAGTVKDRERAIQVSSVPSKVSNESNEPRTRKRITQEDLDEAVGQLLGLGDSIDGKGKGEIVEMSGIEPRLWLPSLKFITENGLWRYEGEKRSRVYFLA